MTRCMRIVSLVLIGALAACVNAPGDSGGGGNSNLAGLTGGDVTAGSEGAQTVNGTIHVPAGQKTGNVGTVNGAIQIDGNATLAAATTVNGSISVGPHAAADSVTTVNGSIALDDGAHVARMATTVNGSVTLHDGVQVEGALTTVNGAINLHNAQVGGGITTVDGSISVEGDSHVSGGILVKKVTGSNWFNTNSPPRIVIGPGAIVTGELRFERPVQLYVSDKASIGPVIGATPVKFSGDNPPG